MKKFFFVKFYVFLADLTLYNLFFLKKTHNNVPYHFKLKSNFVGQIWPFVLKGLNHLELFHYPLVCMMVYLFIFKVENVEEITEQVIISMT